MARAAKVSITKSDANPNPVLFDPAKAIIQSLHQFTRRCPSGFVPVYDLKRGLCWYSARTVVRGKEQWMKDNDCVVLRKRNIAALAKTAA